MLHLLPRILHTLPAAYPLCEVTSAAIWKQHHLSHDPTSSAAAADESTSGWKAVRHHVFEAGAGNSFEDMMAPLLGQSSVRGVMPVSVQPFNDDGAAGVNVGLHSWDSCGCVPDLEAAVFQNLDL